MGGVLILDDALAAVGTVGGLALGAALDPLSGDHLDQARPRGVRMGGDLPAGGDGDGAELQHVAFEPDRRLHRLGRDDGQRLDRQADMLGGWLGLGRDHDDSPIVRALALDSGGTAGVRGQKAAGQHREHTVTGCANPVVD